MTGGKYSYAYRNPKLILFAKKALYHLQLQSYTAKNLSNCQYSKTYDQDVLVGSNLAEFQLLGQCTLHDCVLRTKQPLPHLYCN